MNLFHFLNGWAGQNAFVDSVLRFIYVGAVPALATLWLALLFFRNETSSPRLEENASFIGGATRVYGASSRRAVLVATLFSLAICGALWLIWNWFAQNILGASILSPRPFASHWVNLLVIEPNDNSFPSPEAMLLGVFWIASWATTPRWNFVAFFVALSGCLARVICGTHYVADVLVGWIIGSAVAALTMAFFGVVLRFSPRPFRQRAWRLRAQSALSLGALAMIFAFGALTLYNTPRLLANWQQRGATQLANSFSSSLRAVEYSKNASHEGEGAASSSAENTTDAHGKEVPRVGVTTLGGFLPREETRLLRVLKAAKLAHSLVSIDVAALRDKGFEMHCAAVRFQVRHSGAWERKRVAQTAQRIVQLAFATDSALQNVDVVGVVLNDPQRDGVRYPVFAVGAIPVWTASIQRQNLVSNRFAPWLNAPNADAGLWLRARSKIYINERVLSAHKSEVSTPPAMFIEAPATSSTPSTRKAPSATPQPFAPKVAPPLSALKSAPQKPNTSQQTNPLPKNSPTKVAPSKSAPTKTANALRPLPSQKLPMQKPQLQKPQMQKTTPKSAVQKPAQKIRRPARQMRNVRRPRRFYERRSSYQRANPQRVYRRRFVPRRYRYRARGER